MPSRSASRSIRSAGAPSSARTTNPSCSQRSRAVTRRTIPYGCAAITDSGRDTEFDKESFDPPPDLVANRADGSYIEAGRVVELPILVAFAGVERARVATAHCDDDVGRLHDLVRPRLRELAGDVDPDLGHGGDRGRVDFDARLRAARPRDGPVAGQIV